MSLLPRTIVPFLLAVTVVALSGEPTRAQDTDSGRTIEVETTEVTASDVATTPDGETLICTPPGTCFVCPSRVARGGS